MFNFSIATQHCKFKIHDNISSSNPAPLRIAGFEEESIVDGPGIRFVIFFQGCPHRCPGCHNPETHDPTAGTAILPENLLEKIHNRSEIRSVTFSGGEPFFQAKPLLKLARTLRSEGYHLCAYTGYAWEELIVHPEKKELLSLMDLLIDGPFILKKRSLELAFRGSLNQRIIDVQKSLLRERIILSPLHFS